MPFFGVPIRNGLPIGLGSVAGFGVQQFDPSQLFEGGTVAGAWYDPSDLSTMFDTSAGTTPVAMPGQGAAVPVGLMLDKSQNGVGTNGAYRYNLLTYTEQFDNAAWVKDGSTAANTTATTDPLGGNTADVLTATLALYAYTYQSTPVSTITATFSCYVKAATASVFWLYYESAVLNGVAYFGTDLTTQVVAGSSQTPSNLTITSVGNGWFRISAQWSTVAGSKNFGVGISDAKGLPAITIGRTGYIWGAQVASVAAPTAYQRIDANWYSTMAGNHAISFNNTTARPELRARVNLLEYSEQFDNGYWTKSNATVTSNVVAAPNGTITADKLIENTATDNHFVRPSSFVAGTYTFSCFLRQAERTWAVLSSLDSTVKRTFFDLSLGVLGTVSAGHTATIVPAGNGWYQCTITVNVSAVSNFFYIGIANADNGNSYTGDGTSGIYIWGADLRPANIGANVPAYQRIADANTYDTSGFPLYLRFDGIDDSMYTPANLNLSGTDKATVFAGVRKLSDAADGLLAETSITAASNAGAFNFGGPSTLGTTTSYGALFNGAGFSDRAGVGANTYAAPITNVVQVSFDYAGTTILDEIKLRINGVLDQDVQFGSPLATRNFASYPLYIGARNNTTTWFNGHLHGLIVVGSAVNAGNISATEQWVAGKTGIQI